MKTNDDDDDFSNHWYAKYFIELCLFAIFLGWLSILFLALLCGDIEI